MLIFESQWLTFFLFAISPVVVFGETTSATSKNCVSDTYIPHTPNAMYGFNSTNPAKLYPDVESFLQVYKQLLFKCDGWAKGIVLYPAQTEIKSVNIAIFRIDLLDDLLVMVDSTPIRDVTPPLGNKTWFYYEFPKPIQGKKGDFVGIYYDNWRTVYSDLVIRSVNGEATPWAAPYITDDTLVFRLDSRLAAPGASMDMEIAEIKRRLPAMAVLIVPEKPTTPPPTSPLPPGLPRQCSMDVLPDDINCANTSRRFRYSPTQMRCYEFLGCDTMTTSNNFPTARECLALCIWPFSTTLPPVTRGGGDDGSNVEGDARCSEQLTVDDTTCTTPTTERWNFNPFYRQCRPFLGCERTAAGNNWDSEYQCQASCIQGNSTEPGTSGDSRCFSDASLGQWLCLYKEPRYYWDKIASGCKQFFGCPYRNNLGFPIGNNFGSYSGCVASCSGPISTTKKP